MSKESHSFSVAVAEEVGVNAAILIGHLLFLQKSNAPDGTDWRRFMVRRTAKTLRKTYPYFSEKEIRGAFERMEKAGLIESVILNKIAYDRAKSYRLTSSGLQLLDESESDQNGKLHVTKGKMEVAEVEDVEVTKGKMPNGYSTFKNTLHSTVNSNGENEFSPTTDDDAAQYLVEIYEPVRRETLRADAKNAATSNGARRDALGEEFADVMATQFGAKIVTVKTAEPPVKAWRPFDLENELDALTTDYTVAENFTLSRKIPKVKFGDYVAAFRLEAKAQGGEYHSRKEFRQHFFNWAAKRHESEQRKAAQAAQGIPTISDNLKTQTKRPLNPIC